MLAPGIKKFEQCQNDESELGIECGELGYERSAILKVACLAGVWRGRKEERRAREAREDRTREDRGKQNSQKFELSSCNKMEEQKKFNKPLFF